MDGYKLVSLGIRLSFVSCNFSMNMTKLPGNLLFVKLSFIITIQNQCKNHQKEQSATKTVNLSDIAYF